MNHYDDFFKEQYDRIQRKLDKIAGDFIYSRQLPEDMFIDNPKFMEVMGISQKTAQAWRDKGTISYSQVGNKIYYRISDIKELLDSHHIKATRKEEEQTLLLLWVRYLEMKVKEKLPMFFQLNQIM